MTHLLVDLLGIEVPYQFLEPIAEVLLEEIQQVVGWLDVFEEFLEGKTTRRLAGCHQAHKLLGDWDTDLRIEIYTATALPGTQVRSIPAEDATDEVD